MDSDKQPESKTNKLKELHGNIRHITQLAMNWFAFFVTVNYLTMGWLAKRPSSAGESIYPNIIRPLAGVFIVQNGLGIVGLILVLKSATWMRNEVNDLQNPPSVAQDTAQEVTPKSESIPINLYIDIGVFLMFVLVSLIVAWVIIIVTPVL